MSAKVHRTHPSSSGSCVFRGWLQHPTSLMLGDPAQPGTPESSRYSEAISGIADKAGQIRVPSADPVPKYSSMSDTEKLGFKPAAARFCSSSFNPGTPVLAIASPAGSPASFLNSGTGCMVPVFISGTRARVGRWMQGSVLCQARRLPLDKGSMHNAA